MPTQFQQALSSFLKENTSNFNIKYGTTGQAPMRPSSMRVKRPGSQKELAQMALSSSPKEFNEQFAYSPKGGKTRKHRKSKKSRKGKSRRRR